MKPGEVVRLTKETAQSLIERDKADMQLILRKHGAKTWDFESDWNRELTPYEYAIESLDSLTPDELIFIHEYVIGEDAAPSAVTRGAEIWGDSPARGFISHHHSQGRLAGSLREVMITRYGIDAFVAHENIDTSFRWRDSIRAGLDTCHFLVALLDDQFHSSQWCDQEVGWAFGRNIPVIPVRTSPADIRRDGFLEEVQDCSLAPQLGKGEYFLAHEVLQTIVRDSRTREVGVEALIEALVNSYSFDQTRRLWGLISELPYLETNNIRRLEFAVETNSQVYQANVNGRDLSILVSELASKFAPKATSWPEVAPF